ncbi:MAG TPA: tRNA (adenosine(37)-N6)-dimethylallyltransferase MiaA, partial [Thermoleophilia bacterium]|nr:tRNA (adenosine(37)-N6)-dimethylallyltransferase MiaA [Thermoleophilia bacterium]
MADVDAPTVALFGPTGMGKTEIALALARLLDAEIVSADSMQVYRGLPILTNQPTPSQLALVPHHLVGVLDPRQECSAAEYARLAGAVVDDIRARGRRVVLEGGSGLYLRAGLGGLAFGAPPSPTHRAALEHLAESDPQALLERLRAADPRAYEAIDRANLRRVVRAVETAEAHDRPSAAGQRGRLWDAQGAPHAFRLFALDVDRTRLRERVDARVDEMVARGLVDEVAALPQPLSRTVRQAIGVREILSYLAGELTLDEATSRMKSRTRGYVRRQLTWMRKLDADIIPASA